MYYLFIIVLLVTGCGADVAYYYDIDNFYEEEEMATKDGWAKSGFIGMGELALPLPDGRLSNQTIQMQADFTENGGGPGGQYYTVQVGTQRPPGGIYDVRADIVWSVAGNDVRRTVSVGDGCVVSGTGQMVKVEVYDVTDVSAFTPEPFPVSIQITKGTRPSVNKPPSLDLGVAVVPDTTFQDIDIPLDSGVISVNFQVTVLPTPTAIPEFDTVCYFLQAGNIIGAFDPANNPEGFVPVPAVADAIRLENQTGGGDDVAFYVRFGIEG